MNRYELRIMEDFGPTWLVQVRHEGGADWIKLVDQKRFDSWEAAEKFALELDPYFLFRD